MIAAPSARRRFVGQALRRYREGLGYSLDDAGRVIGCSRSKISRIETGDRGIRISELQTLLTDYGVEDQARAVLAAIAGPRTAKGWWREYSGLLPDARRDFYVLETVASQILVYEAQRIPELLQTAEYARAFMAANPGLPDDDARAMATEALQGRQHAILHEDGPDIRVILGEAALRQVVGSAAVMQAQLAALANISGGNVHVTVQVLPFTSGAHAAAATGSLAILRFAQAPPLGLVHLDSASGGTCLEDQTDLAVHVRVFEQLSAFALTPVASAGVLRELAAT